MRYGDWDVLLFPAGGQVPVKEFGTTYFNVPALQGGVATALLTAFCPALEHGTLFQISIHCWSRQTPLLDSWAGVDVMQEAWQLVVTIDGIVNCVETCAADTTWPRVFSNSGVDGKNRKLAFPHFNGSILSQHTWDARDDAGRIKIELTAGYLSPTADEGSMQYHQLTTVACFSFQPAPLDFLKRCGIAWPNASVRPCVFPNPFVQQPTQQTPTTPMSINHGRRRSSAGNGYVFHDMSGGDLPTMPYPTKVSGGLYKFHSPTKQDPFELLDASSRSTSSYSAYGLFANKPIPPYPDSVAAHAKKQLELRLPSDQLRQIINAISPPNEKDNTSAMDGSSAAQTTMPPPPLPLHAPQSSLITTTGDPRIQANIAARISSAMNANLISNGHGPSRSSDTSMHAACNYFPTCTTEDSEGRPIHQSGPYVPAPIVRGRKEGASSPKSRDFFSTILDHQPASSIGGDAHATTNTITTATSAVGKAKANVSSSSSSSPAYAANGKKRTRAALKSLSLNDGSPEKLSKKKSSSVLEKPARKLSRPSLSGSGIAAADKENVDKGAVFDDGMVLDR